MATIPYVASTPAQSEQFKLSLHGVPSIVERLRAIRGTRADAIVSQSINRGARSARSDIVRDLRAAAPTVPRKELMSRVTIRPGAQPGELHFRIVGAGKHGRGYLRPRHLGLPMRRRDEVAWGVDGMRAERLTGFVVSPGSGSKSSGREIARMGKDADGSRGRNFTPAGAPGFDRKKALVFMRVGAGRYPIRRVSEPFTAGMLLNRGNRLERARMVIVSKITTELHRRYEVELNRR